MPTRPMSRADRVRELIARNRVWTAPQVAAVAFGDTSASAVRECERVLAALAEAGWVRRTRVHARPVPDLSGGPLARWEPGDRLPNAGSIHWRATARWVDPPRVQTVWHAGRRLLSHTGRAGDGRIRQPLQVSHDLAASQVLTEFVLTQNRAHDAAVWVGEDHLDTVGEFGRAFRGRVPDAVIARPQGLPLVIDFVGCYPRDRIDRLIRFYSGLRGVACQRPGTPFELW